MATLTTSRRKGIALTPAERRHLAKLLRSQMDKLGYDVAAAAQATGYAEGMIRGRLRDKGEGKGTPILLSTWVALCDGLQLDPDELARSLGVEIDLCRFGNCKPFARQAPESHGRQSQESQPDGRRLARAAIQARIDNALTSARPGDGEESAENDTMRDLLIMMIKLRLADAIKSASVEDLDILYARLGELAGPSSGSA